MPTSGDTLGGRYLLGRMLGEGGMGQVFEATNQNTGRRVAIKTLQAEWVSQAAVVQRFLREARAATSISHPNVVDVLDLDTDPGLGIPYIVQEFLVGETLEAYLDAQPGQRLAPADALAIVLPTVAAMIAAHRKGVVHRDLKPANIFLTRDAEGAIVPKVIDFGIARVDDTRPDAAGRTGTGTTIGTPSYMSPEQAAGRNDIDARTDVWSMGVVLYEALTARLPYEAPNANLLIGKLLYEPATPVLVADPGLPPDLAAVVDRTLVRDRDARIASMDDLQAALRACAAAGGAFPSVVPPTPALRPPASTAVTPSNSSPSLVSWSGPTNLAPRAPKRLPLMAVAAGVTLLLVGVAAWLSAHPSGPRPAVVHLTSHGSTPPAPPPVTAIVAPSPVAPPPALEAPPVLEAPAAVVAPVAPPPVTAPAPRATRPRPAATTGRRGRPAANPGFDTDYQ